MMLECGRVYSISEVEVVVIAAVIGRRDAERSAGALALGVSSGATVVVIALANIAVFMAFSFSLLFVSVAVGVSKRCALRCRVSS